MADINLDKDFWQEIYELGEMGWDIGHPSRPLKEYIDQLTDTQLKILIPGAGNAWEAEHLFEKGFQNVHVLDIAPGAIRNFKKRVPGFPEKQLHLENYFDHRGAYDLILEQTFFCALHPELREQYVAHQHGLLKKRGKLVGLLFDDPLNDDHFPFGGNRHQYIDLFSTHFEIEQMEPTHNSIETRAGRELFFICRKTAE